MQPSGRDTHKEYDTVLPWGLTFIELLNTKDGYKFSNMYQCALKGPILNGDTMLFEWPGTNTYNDHRICTGDLKFPTVEKLEQTAGFPFLFYNGINTHIVSGGKFNVFKDKGGRQVDDPFKLYWNLRVDKDNPVQPYPYEILRQAITLNAFLEGKGYK